ncbi:PD-(D/E)XK motif protein [Geodermatophilus sp. SYSU D00696]
MRDDVAAAFHALSRSHEASEVLMASLPVTTPAGDLMAAVDHDGTQHVLVPVPPGTPVVPDRRSKSVTLARRELMVHGARRLFIDVACHRVELRDVFERLAGEICERVLARPDEYRTIPQLTLSRWRQLLEAGKEPLGESGLMGIYGELWVLRQMVAEDPLRRIEHWVGPDRAVHDFRRGAVAVEVKTSSSQNGRTVEIHGSEQLAAPTAGRLYLVYLRLREAWAGMTLRQLIDEIRGLGVDPVDFEQMLARTGISESSDTRPFEVREELWYHIDETFPRVVPTSFIGGRVPEGVLNLNYQLDLAGPYPTALPADARVTVLRELAAL